MDGNPSNYEDNLEGDPKVDRTDPLEMVWDGGAKSENLVDARRIAPPRLSNTLRSRWSKKQKAADVLR
jgi:hypothetical protein